MQLVQVQTDTGIKQKKEIKEQVKERGPCPGTVLRGQNPVPVSGQLSQLKGQHVPALFLQISWNEKYPWKVVAKLAKSRGSESGAPDCHGEYLLAPPRAMFALISLPASTSPFRICSIVRKSGMSTTSAGFKSLKAL
jgi:hypothetical protein